jgi:hypothetical protein
VGRVETTTGEFLHGRRRDKKAHHCKRVSSLSFSSRSARRIIIVIQALGSQEGRSLWLASYVFLRPASEVYFLRLTVILYLSYTTTQILHMPCVA